jgi:hypothetical protein
MDGEGRWPTGSAVGSGGRRGLVLPICDVLAPRHGVALVVEEMHCEMGHEAVAGGAVPVDLSRGEEHPVAGTDDLDRSTPALAQADAFGDVDRLAVGMGVPRGSCAGGEMHAARGKARRLRGRRDRIDVYGSREPVAWTGCGLCGVTGDLGDLHVVSPVSGARRWPAVREALCDQRDEGRRPTTPTH